jgi:hypothetical protein
VTTDEPTSEARIDHGVEELRPAYVRWSDAHADGTGSWLRIEDIEDEPYVVRSTGFVLDEVKKGHISIAQSLGAEEGVVDHVLHIPVGMILSIQYIDVPQVENEA